MPVDDDYGQRERLLLHQHPTKKFETSTTLSTSGSIITANTGIQIKTNNPSMVTNCTNTRNSPDSYQCKLQQQQQQQSESNAASANINNISNDNNSTNQTCDYVNRYKINKYDKQEDKQQYSDQSRSIPSYCERLEMAHNHPTSFTNDNLGISQFSKQQQQQNTAMGYTIPTTDQRLSFSSNDNYQSKTKITNEYANSDILTLSASIKPFSSENFPSPPSPAPTNDHFVPPPPLSPTPSDKQNIKNRNLCRYPSDDCVIPPGSPGLNRERYINNDSSTIKNRFSSAERLLGNNNTQNIIHDNRDHHQQQQQHRYCSSNERLLDTGSPLIMTSHQRDNITKDNDRYTVSTERLISSSPIHPASFTNKTTTTATATTDRYTNNSPTHERYQRQELSNYQDRYSLITSSDKYLSNSMNNDDTNMHYSSTERILGGATTAAAVTTSATSSTTTTATSSRRYSSTDRDNDNQKINERIERCKTSSPIVSDFLCRFSGIQDTLNQSRHTSEQFNDISHHRYTQSSRTNDRYNDHSYFTNSPPATSSSAITTSSSSTATTAATTTSTETSTISTHDNHRLTSDISKYSDVSSTERLYISSSPSSLEHSRYHNNNNNTSSSPVSTTNDRYHKQSPIHDNNHHNYQSQSLIKNDKFIQATKSNYERYQLTNQERNYGFERYGNVNNRYQCNEHEQQQQQQQQRVYGTSERYSPGRNMTDKYLSLPKPKDTFQQGRLTSSSSTMLSSPINNDTRSYNNITSLISTSNTYVPPNAHTPVERYVPQPSPDVYYSDRYNDRYLPPVAHTPTDRYVPSTTGDSNDPYIRRDLGFHHHYRLPPPPTYAFHQSHYRAFRGYPYTSPGRIGGSPGSSSSSSSTSAQREFSTSPLLRTKVRTTGIDYCTSTNLGRNNNHSCCTELTNGQRCCCSVRRSLPPGALPSIPSNQSAPSSWQQSPSSTTTGTSTISTGTDGECSHQSLNMYTVGNRSGNVAPDKSTLTVPAISPSAPSISGSTMDLNTSGTSITRSMSAPAGARPIPIKLPTNSSNINNSATNVGQRPNLERNFSRTEAIKNYIKKETATFFGVNEETENIEKQRWLDRRRRMASRKYGTLLNEHKTTDPDITKDVPDSTDIPDDVTLRRLQQPTDKKESVVRMTLSGINYVVDTITRNRLPEEQNNQNKSRSFPPRVRVDTITTKNNTTCNENINNTDEQTADDDDGDNNEEELFFRKQQPCPSSPTLFSSNNTDHHMSINERTVADGKIDDAKSSNLEHTGTNDCHTSDHTDASDVHISFAKHKDDRPTTLGTQAPRRVRHLARDHYTSNRATTNWQRARHESETDIETSVIPVRQQSDGVTMRREITGGTRIASNTIDRIFDNSNRRQYGMGIVGRYFGRSFRKSVAQKPNIKKQLDHIEDHRPYFTYWITTVQVLVLIISIVCYGFGPIGIDLNHRSGLVLVTSLSLQQVDYQEPANFWIGPRAADLIHLGAKFGPCMRRDTKILKEIDVWRERERDTACCIRNDDSGCVQSSKADCSNTISTWKKWGPGDNGPGGRISGSVCGLDPKFCDAPASVAPYEWPDDITKWPICRKINPFSERFRSNFEQQGGNDDYPVGRYKDKMAEHMVCEVIGHPCCIGIHGMCRITTKEYCDFVHGYFHEEASLCSQVECLHDVCGMMPFFHPEWPDQFYRLFTTIFLHAGILHLIITLLVQYYLMKDLEKLTGSIRISFIYFTGALAGNLASAIFIPYRAEVGPAGAHFALFATLVVEVLNSWPMLKYPHRALSKLIIILICFIILGVLPWVDNYAHIFGFIFGFLASYAMMPFITFGPYDRRRKILLIWICLVLIFSLFGILLVLFYSMPGYECEVCKLVNCIPFTRDFCASQNINFKREETTV
ncbi:inactive rhomboid protein 1 isoform X3 [Aphidius gifuensis]|uniref:inactive rhomboid protein 1 isoform X3 n=1 Tax=Aphidius gifuensis TaxID=684658 RepID=UPI001CDD1F0C|nr:inactive rhomboid protein 1 isoform X3 [Aphidius gifuensis]